MANKYKAIINLGNNSEVITASSPTALGTAIGGKIAADTVDGTELVYEIRGPLSRRMSEKPQG